MIAGALRQLLLDSAAVAALVSNRITWQKLPQNSPLPAVVWQEVDTDHNHAHGARSSGMAEARYQFDSYSNSSVEAYQVSAKIKLALDGFQGIVSYPPDNVVRIFGIFAAGDRPLPADDNTGQYRHSSDYMIKYREEIPT